MGAYFNLRAVKKPPPRDVDGEWPTDPKVTLRSGKLMAKAFAASYEGGARESVARTFTTSIIETYWSRIQQSAANHFTLPELFCLQPATELPDTALTLARTMGEAASTIDPLAASYLISVTYTAMLPDDVRSRLGAYYTPRDSLLAHEPDERSEYFDLVIGNPPHGRISLAAEVQERFKRSLYGHANL